MAAGKINITTIVMGVVGIILLFTIVGELMPEAMDAGDSLNDSNMCVSAGCVYNASSAVCQRTANFSQGLCATSTGIPLNGLLAGGGIVFIIAMAFVLLKAIKAAK